MMVRRRVEGRDRSCVRVAGENSKSAVVRLFRGIDALGYMLRDGRLVPWKAEGVDAGDGACFVYGPLVDAEILPGLLSSLGEAEALLLLADAAEACAGFSREGVLPGAFRLDHLFRIRDGGFLVLAGAVAERTASPGAEPGHPLLSGENAASFALGLAAWRIMTGSPAFAGVRDMETPPPPLRAIRPDIREDAALLVEKALSPARAARAPRPPDLASWAASLRAWAGTGFSRPLAPAELGRLKRRGRRLLRYRGLSAGFRGFLRHSGGRVAAAAAAFAALLFFGLPVLRGVLAEPASAGLDPAAVVRLFYSSLGKLDHPVMRDCVAGNAGREYIETAAHLYAVSRVRGAVEGVKPVMDAEEWNRSGRPSGTAAYGAAGLVVEGVPGGAAEERIFLVRFELRIPSPDSVRGSEGVLVTDRTLTGFGKKGWRITRIERIEEKRISPPALP